MEKEELIYQIFRIIGDYGSFTTADVAADSSPCIASLGSHTHQLIEQFGPFKVTAITYVHDTEVDEDYIRYNDLSEDILEEILVLAEIWEAQELQTLKRISD